MGLKYLIDTNVVIAYLDNKLPKDATAIIDTNEINLSVINRIELLVWSKATREQLLAIEDFINAANVHTLAEATILETIALRKNDKMKLPDAIVAVTAIVNNLCLVTRNEKDFMNIQGLAIINPWKV